MAELAIYRLPKRGWRLVGRHHRYEVTTAQLEGMGRDDFMALHERAVPPKPRPVLIEPDDWRTPALQGTILETAMETAHAAELAVYQLALEEWLLVGAASQCEVTTGQLEDMTMDEFFALHQRAPHSECVRS